MRQIASHHTNAAMVDWHYDLNSEVHYIRTENQHIRTESQIRAGHIYGDFVRQAARKSGSFDGIQVTGKTL